MWAMVLKEFQGLLLAGRAVRLPDATAADVQHVLDRAGLSARIDEVPATLDDPLIGLAHA